MKSTIVSIALVMGLGMIVGELKADEPDYENLCRDYAKLGEAIMTKRQNGESIRNVLDSTKSNPFAKYMTEEAWGRPGWHTDDRRSAAVTEFGDDMYMICLRIYEE